MITGAATALGAVATLLTGGLWARQGARFVGLALAVGLVETVVVSFVLASLAEQAHSFAPADWITVGGALIATNAVGIGILLEMTPSAALARAAAARDALTKVRWLEPRHLAASKFLEAQGKLIRSTWPTSAEVVDIPEGTPLPLDHDIPAALR